MSESENHVHTFIKTAIKPINRITNVNYKGTAGDKALVMSQCDCGALKAIDYGPINEIKMKWTPENLVYKN